MRKRESKITVIIIGGIIILYLLFVALNVFKEMECMGLSLGGLIGLGIGIGIILTVIYTVYDRLKEMKGEDEDDFSKY